MSEDLIQVLETPKLIDPPKVEKPKKEKKARAPMSAEKKAKLLENLAKARTKAAANRKAKKEAKAAAKPKQVEHVSNDVRSEPAKVTKPAEIDPRDAELAELREKVKSMTLQDIVKKPRAKKKRVPKVKTAVANDTDDEENEVRTEATRPSPQKTVRPKSPEPSPSMPVEQKSTPTVPQQRQVSAPAPVVPKKKKQLFGRKKRR